ncbi:DUF2187 family protein [Lysinibacillus sp. KU-BSD001]|uniref:DUF2187 family protein n=1 Tax=Lysinibacillus sp. KU-BSD001 TaxID=3141328 RepID=UPI0036E3061F
MNINKKGGFFMAKAKPVDVIEWEDRKTKVVLTGVVRKLLEKSVIVDICGTDDATVVSHKRYEIISEGIDAAAVPTKQHPHRRK